MAVRATAFICLLAVIAVTSLEDGGRLARRKRQAAALNGNDLISLLSSLAGQGGGPGGLASNLLQQYQQSQSQGPQGSGPLDGLLQLLQGARPGPYYPQGQFVDQGGGGFGLYNRPVGQYPPPYAGAHPYPFQRPVPPGYGQFPPGAPGPFPGPGPYPGGGSLGFTEALSSIAQYDDLRCVPRLLCEVASGGRPTYGKQESLVPFISKDALLTLLTVMNFADTSPLFSFGRAALLGITSRGDTKACFTAYPTCPRDPDTLVNYLNNHNGGFFRFFNQHQNKQQQQLYAHGQYAPHYTKLYGKRPKYGLQKYPQKYYQQQQQQQQYQYQQPQYPYIQQRIQNTKSVALAQNQYDAAERPSRDQSTRVRDQFNFPPYGDKYYTTSPSYNPLTPGSSQDYLQNDRDKGRTLRFPRNDEERTQGSAPPQVLFGDSGGGYHKKIRGSKSISFPGFEDGYRNEVFSPTAIPMVFPDRTGTGDLRLDTDKYGNTVIFSASDVAFKPESVRKGTRSLKFPNEDTRKQRYVKYTKPQSLKFPQYRYLGADLEPSDELGDKV